VRGTGILSVLRNKYFLGLWLAQVTSQTAQNCLWFALSIRTLLLAVPVQGFGGLGTTQLWWTAGLTLLGYPAGEALATSLAIHLLDLCVSLPQAALGWASLQWRRTLRDDEALPAEAEAQRV